MCTWATVVVFFFFFFLLVLVAGNTCLKTVCPSNDCQAHQDTRFIVLTACTNSNVSLSCVLNVLVSFQRHTVALKLS